MRRTSHRLKRLTSALAVGALAVAIAAGCITESTAPTTPASVKGAAGALDDGGSGGDGGSLLGSILDPLAQLIFKIVSVPFGQSATITNGRWRLDVPAGAIAGDATVGIGVQSPTAFSCKLQILPDNMNHFAIPVTVTANCRDIDQDKLKTWVIWWFDPAQNKWVIVPNSKVDLTRGTVSAPLPHCSFYAAGPAGGKAGW